MWRPRLANAYDEIMRFLSASTMTVLLVACGGGDSSVSLDELATELASASCERSFSCCDAAEIEAQFGFFDIETEAECTMVIAGFAEQFLIPQLEAGVESGRIVYHGDRMGACLSLMRSLECGAELEGAGSPLLGISCEDPFEGQVANGDACASDEECQSDTCIGETMDFEGNTTEGTCGNAPPVGSPCTEDFECAEGAWCDSGSGSTPTCAAPQDAGAECFSGEQCDSGNCDDPDTMDGNPGTCSSELVCDGM